VVGLGRLGTPSDGRAPADGGMEGAGATDDRAAGIAAGGGWLTSGAAAAGDGGGTGTDGDAAGDGAATERRKPSGNGMPDSRGRGRRSFDPAAELPFC
jgi:hypothetical protein